jgi:hypothetical protein
VVLNLSDNQRKRAKGNTITQIYEGNGKEINLYLPVLANNTGLSSQNASYASEDMFCRISYRKSTHLIFFFFFVCALTLSHGVLKKKVNICTST